MSSAPAPIEPLRPPVSPHHKQPVSVASDQTRNEATAAERILLGAMLRDVQLMPQVIGGLNITALTNIHTAYGPVFAEIVRQYNERGHYTVLSIEKKTGIDLDWIYSDDTSIDLPWALEHWWAEYSKWATLHAYSAAVGFPKAADALAMRENVAKAREALGLNWTPKTDDDGDGFVEWVDQKIEGKEVNYPMKSPILALREYIQCFEPPYLWTIAAETSAGKTQFALNLFSSFCDQGANGLFISLEMPANDVRKRLLGIRHGINPATTWQPQHHEHIRQCGREVRDVTKGKIIDNTFAISEIEAACVSAHFNGGLQFVFIDLLGYVTASTGKANPSPNDEISKITKTLVRLAKRLHFMPVLIHHLSRESKRQGGSMRPKLHHLKDSGSVEQDSSGVIFLYRPAYHNILEDERGKSTLIKDGTGKVVGDIGEIIVAKNRNGPLGTVYARWSNIRGYRDLEDYVPPTVGPAVTFLEAKKTNDADLPF